MSTSHGYGAYTNGCRCQTCRTAKANYMRKRRATARYRAQAAAGDGERLTVTGITHGTRYGYEEAGCRCTPCTTARTDADRRYWRATRIRQLIADLDADTAAALYTQLVHTPNRSNA